MIKNNILTSIMAVFLVFGIGQSVNATPSQPDSQASVAHIDDQNFDKILSANSVVVVDFYADWCTPCRRFLPVFEQVAEEMSQDALFAKVNIDHAPNVRNQCEAKSIPTIILFKNGKEIRRNVGLLDANGFRSFVKAAF